VLSPVLKIILRRLAFGLLTLVVISVLVFAATQALPGDTATAILGKSATPERVKVLEKQLGLDRPLYEQYFSWVAGILRGDFGNSLVGTMLPVTQMIGRRLMNTLALMLIAALIDVPTALVLGSLSGRFRDGLFDGFVSVGSLTFAALPTFVIGIMLILAFATQILQILPAVSRIEPDASVWSQMDLLWLPALTLALASAPFAVRMLRGSMIEVLESDYVQMARLKGTPERLVLQRHALPNAIVPFIQVVALDLAWMIGGVVTVEYLFNFPGIGALLVSAVSDRDVPVIQALVLLIASAYVVFNLVADILTILVTPRLRTGLQ
jgi:peptide/nickel transport system permease protein